MKLAEALQIITAAPKDGAPFEAVLACGFTPLHLKTLLTAHLQRELPGRCIRLKTGLFGDLAGTLRGAQADTAHAAVVVLEWADLDPRLGYRSLGGWGPAEENDIARQVEFSLQALEPVLRRVSENQPVVISLPTLPFPPAFRPPAGEAGETQTVITASLQEFTARVVCIPNVRLLNNQQLALDSPVAGRLDLKADLTTGFPYSLTHASCLAAALARLIAPPAPKKGLITDLDDTFWKGIVGEIGPDKVSWDLNGHSQLHGLYQQVLRALADQGVLIGIASKNDPAVVDQTFERKDIVLTKDKIFPVEVHWNAKSGSVSRVIKSWNIGADAVVFVDDSPMELAEVQQAHPGIEGILFPKDEYQKFEGFLRRLRDLFGKAHVSAEDTVRRESLRQAAEFSEELSGGEASDEFLRGLNATITVDRNAASDPRSLELINKTNQFNLNGSRYGAGEWQALTRRPDQFVWSMAYRDKFGALGKIAVIHGQQQNGVVMVEAWVMSCRAFARRIEHQSVKALFEQTGAKEIVFSFQPTERNGPCKDFFLGVTGSTPSGNVRITRDAFLTRCPALFHSMELA